MRCMVVLVSEDRQADEIIGLLRSQVRPADGLALNIVRPPSTLLGTGFWDCWREARDWWEATIGTDSAGSILLIDDRPDLEHELRGLASEWVVWCWDETRANHLVEAAPNVTVLLAGSAEAFAEGVADFYGPGGGGPSSRLLFHPSWGPFQPAPIRPDAPPPPPPPPPPLGSNGSGSTPDPDWYHERPPPGGGLPPSSRPPRRS